MLLNRPQCLPPCGADFSSLLKLHSDGNPTDFVTVDARSAGEGQLVAEVRSTSGGVPSDLGPTITKKVYLLTFVPKEGGDHHVTVTFNDESVPRKYRLGAL